MWNTSRVLIGSTLTKTEADIVRTYDNNINMHLREDSCHCVRIIEHSGCITKISKPLNCPLSLMCVCVVCSCCTCKGKSVCVYAMKTFRGRRGMALHSFLTLELTVTLGLLHALGASPPPQGNSLSSHWIGGRIGPSTGLEVLVETKMEISCPCLESNHGSFSL
jgi:hypothetical protein